MTNQFLSTIENDKSPINWALDFPSLVVPKRVLTFLSRHEINTYEELFQLTDKTIGMLRSGTGKTGQEVLRLINDIRAIETFYGQQGISLVSVKNSFNTFVHRIETILPDAAVLTKELSQFYLELFTLPWSKGDVQAEMQRLPSYTVLEQQFILQLLKQKGPLSMESLVTVYQSIWGEERDISQHLERCMADNLVNREGELFFYNEPSVLSILKERSEEKDFPILAYRMEGLTLEEIGHRLDVTRERVRQRERKALKVLGSVYEDRYQRLFETYEWSPESLAVALDTEPSIFYFLKLKYKMGSTDIESLLDDETVDPSIRIRIDQFLKKDLLHIGDSYVKPKKSAILYWFVSTYCVEEIQLQDAFNKYTELLNAANVDSSLRFDLRNFGVRIADSLYTVWKYQKRFRYYETRLVDINQLLADLGFGEYNDMEISTALFVANRPDVLADWEIHDKYELHNIIKKCLSRINGFTIECLRMPNISIGNAQRDTQVIKLLHDASPISVQDFAELYESTYGVDKLSFTANYMAPVAAYKNGDMLSLDVEKMGHEMLNEARLALTQNFYSLKEIGAVLNEHFKCDMSAYVNSYNIKMLGYTLSNRTIYKSSFSGITTALEAHIADNGLTNSRLLDQSMYSSSTFYAAIAELRRQYKIFEVMPNQYIHVSQLESMGVSHEEIADFVQSVKRFVKETYFTYSRLVKQGFTHPLQRLGLSDYFYSSLLRWSDQFVTQNYRYTTLMSREVEKVFLHDLLQLMLGNLDNMPAHELCEQLKQEYGIDYFVDFDKFLEHCHRGGLEYSKTTRELYKA